MEAKSNFVILLDMFFKPPLRRFFIACYKLFNWQNTVYVYSLGVASEKNYPH
jgi:hypothetical protein